METQTAFFINYKYKILLNINYCTKCNGSKTVGCGFRGIIFGKDYGDLCHAPLWFVNPDTETLESIKIFVEIRKQIIDDKQCS